LFLASFIEALRLYLADLLTADRRCSDCFETVIGTRERWAAPMALFVFDGGIWLSGGIDQSTMTSR
jgi:hypothetical protein